MLIGRAPKCLCTRQEIESGYLQGDMIVFPCKEILKIKFFMEDYVTDFTDKRGHTFHDVKFSFGRQYIKSDKPIKITHDKFDTIVLPPGGYWIQYIPDIIKIKK